MSYTISRKRLPMLRPMAVDWDAKGEDALSCTVEIPALFCSTAHYFRHMARILAIGLSVLLAWGLASPAAADPMVFAFSRLPPWKTVEGTDFVGAYTEIVRELAKRTGTELKIFPCPSKRCLKMIEDGQADVIIGVQPSPERQAYIHFLSTPYRRFSSDKVFYVLKGKAATIRSYDDLKTLRIGITNGSRFFDRFDKDASLNKDVVNDVQANFKKLVHGRVDAVLMAEDQGEAVLYGMHLQNQIEKAQYRVRDRTPRSVGFSRKSAFAPMFPEFEAAMAAMVKDGTLQAIYKRYYFDTYHVPYDAFPLN